MTPVVALQRPRVELVPDYVSSAGAEAVDLAAMAGLHLDEWQAMVLKHALGERDDGKWAAFEIGLNVGRQNGKNAILEARELAGLFILDEELIVHTAHEFATAREALRRLEDRIRETPELWRRVKTVTHAHGDEGIELKSGQRIRFRTRTKGGGRGFSADCVIFDEAMFLAETSIGALLPTLSARPNPQVWYTGSAVDQVIHDHGVAFSRVRERGLRGEDHSLAYFEWSFDPREEGDVSPLNPETITAEQSSSLEAWAQANPSLGIRIDEEDIDREQRTMDPRTFAVERLGVGDWPATDPSAGGVIDIALWRSLTDTRSSAEGPLAFAFDVTPDRASSSICTAGKRGDGLIHVEVIDRRPGTGWLPDRMAELEKRHGAQAIICDGAGPAGALAEDVRHACGQGVSVLTSQDYVKACGLLFDMTDQRRLRHLGTPELDAAIRGAAKRPLVDAWAWSRKSSRVDISPLVAVTLAAWWIAEKQAPSFVFEVLG